MLGVDSCAKVKLEGKNLYIVGKNNRSVVIDMELTSVQTCGC